MALDVIAEAVVRTIGGFLFEYVFLKLFYWPGWLILRVITLGRYPPKAPEPHSEGFVALFGAVTLMVAVLLTVPGGGI